MTAVVWVLAVVLAVTVLFVIGLLRSHAEIIRALHDAGISLDPDRAPDLPDDHRHHDAGHRTAASPVVRTVDGVPGPADLTGRRATDLAGTTPTGATRTVAVAETDGATLLAFLTTGCSTCAGFWAAFADGVKLPAGTRLVVVTKGPGEESPADVAAIAAPHVLTVQSTDAWNEYRIPVAPYFVLVDGSRGVIVGEGAAGTWDRVETLIEKALADAGYPGGQVRRRDLLLGQSRHDRVDQDLLEAGLEPGDPRLYHAPSDFRDHP